MLTIGSLFSGIGGLELGLERAGMSVEWQVEYNAYCQKVLSKHWPDAARYGDIRECGVGRANQLTYVDVLCGGFPCQPHSLAGKRGASTDERDLWPEYFRLICEIKPLYVVAENVMGLLSSEGGHFFGSILRDLASIGYDAEWNCISAASVGALHLRKRIFLVAYPRCTNEYGRVLYRNGSENSSRSTIQTIRRENRLVFEVGTAPHTRLRESPWSIEPDLDRMVNGVSFRMDRLKALGNAVVPQCSEVVGRLIMAREEAMYV